MSDQTKLNEKLRKQIYRANLREQSGNEEYKNQQAQKKENIEPRKKQIIHLMNNNKLLKMLLKKMLKMKHHK